MEKKTKRGGGGQSKIATNSVKSISHVIGAYPGHHYQKSFTWKPVVTKLALPILTP